MLHDDTTPFSMASTVARLTEWRHSGIICMNDQIFLAIGRLMRGVGGPRGRPAFEIRANVRTIVSRSSCMGFGFRGLTVEIGRDLSTIANRECPAYGATASAVARATPVVIFIFADRPCRFSLLLGFDLDDVARERTGAGPSRHSDWSGCVVRYHPCGFDPAERLPGSDWPSRACRSCGPRHWRSARTNRERQSLCRWTTWAYPPRLLMKSRRAV